MPWDSDTNEAGLDSPEAWEREVKKALEAADALDDTLEEFVSLVDEKLFAGGCDVH